jgi:hypothetical protein
MKITVVTGHARYVLPSCIRCSAHLPLLLPPSPFPSLLLPGPWICLSVEARSPGSSRSNPRWQ